MRSLASWCARLRNNDAIARPVPTDSIAPLFRRRSNPDAFERISRTVPGGFASIERDSTGRFVVRMVDTTKADTIRAALREPFTAGRSPVEKAGILRELATARAERVSLSMAQLIDWNDYVATFVIGGPAVVGVGVNVHRQRIEVDVADENGPDVVEARLGSRRIPCGLVVIKITGPVRLL